MNLTVGELSELPLAAALIDGDEVLAATPEWSGAAPGAVCYRAHRARLVVSGGETHPVCADVTTRLLDEVEGAATRLPHRQAMRVRMLAASLRLVAGRGSDSAGTSSDVLEHACAGIASRSALGVRVELAEDFACDDPAAAALVLVQLAVNAERHDHAASVDLCGAEQVFTVRWDASPGNPSAATARRRAERERWGLGFARIAADSIGGAVYLPAPGEGPRTATLEVGLRRLALPLALLHDGTVQKATRAWDEETGLLPGAPVPNGSRAALCAEAATAASGAVAAVDGWTARAGARGVWVAIPRDDVMDRARDVLDGMVHERALWESVPEPSRSRIVALAAVLAALLGAELARVPGDTWNRRAAEVALAYGLRMAVPRFDGVGAVDPRVALFLAVECGEALEVDGDDLYLRVAAERRDDALVRVFLAPGDDSLKLS